MGRNLNNATGKIIRSYADKGLTFSEICATTGFASSTVSLYTKDFGYYWKESHSDIAKLRKSGCSITEICSITGKDRKIISSKCRAIGLGETNEEKKQLHELDSQSKRHSEEQISHYISEKSEGRLEYISGYINMDSHILVKCTYCGCEQDRALSSFRTCKNVLCKICKYNPVIEIEQEKKHKEKEKQKQLRKIEKETQRLVKMGRGEQMSFRFCACGEMLEWSDGHRRKQCKICAKKAENKRHEIIRRCKISKALVDSDITLFKLYKRDNGFCYLCGKVCDWNDKEVRANVIICGNQYPSIDHIVPLSKGGLHSWNNVKLAHRICNSLKGDKYDFEPMEKTYSEYHD